MVLAMSSVEEPRAVSNALDPLSAAEVETCVAVAREAVEIGPRTRFVAASTAEPPHGDHAQGRRAELLLHQPDQRSVARLIVDLERGEAASIETLPGVEPALGLDEVARFERAMRADPRF